MAAQTGSQEFMSRALKSGVKPGGEDLCEAVRWEQTDVVQALLWLGVNPNSRDRDGRTPLIEASGRSLSLTRLLVDEGAKINLVDRNGDSPLMNAVILGIPRETYPGADKNWETSQGVRQEKSIRIVEFLLAHGAHVNIRNKEGLTALDMASNPETEALLKSHGAKYGELKLGPH